MATVTSNRGITLLDWLERLNRGLGQIPLGQGTIEVLHWAYARHLADNNPHRHTFFEVCLVGGHGEGEFVVQGKTLSLRPGDVFVARPGVVHQIRNTAEPEMELFWVCFQWTPAPQKPPGDVDRLLKAFAEAEVCVVPDAEARLALIWAAIRVVSEGTPSLGDGAQRQALTAALLLGCAQALSEQRELPEEVAAPGSGEATARLAVRFIHDNLNCRLPLDEIAAQVHVSTRHLSRLVTEFTGSSPAHYIARARLDRARGLLLHTEMPIKEVAVTVGYPDVHHFTRVFTARFGCPPGTLRRHPEKSPVLNIQKHGDLV